LPVAARCRRGLLYCLSRTPVDPLTYLLLGAAAIALAAGAIQGADAATWPLQMTLGLDSLQCARGRVGLAFLPGRIGHQGGQLQ